MYKDYPFEENCKLKIFKYKRNTTFSSLSSILLGYCYICFYKDFIFNIGEYLINSVYDTEALDNFNLEQLLINEYDTNTDHNEIDLNDLFKKLDYRLSILFKYINLPVKWTILGHRDHLDSSKNYLKNNSKH